MKKQILLENDPFYISSRIKEVDENYFFVFNSKEKRFELHNSAQKGSTFALVVPYEVLDERAIFLARKTRKENIDKLVREMDEENRRCEESLKKQAFEQMREVIYES